MICIIKKDELSKLSYSHQVKAYKRGKGKIIRRLEVGKSANPKVLFKSFDAIKNGYCVTLCFHSIVDDVDNCPYPKGAWTPKQFDELCYLISTNKDLEVITQIEACR